MITSMTGFGSITRTFTEYHIQCEIKCLNSKNIDISLSIPRYLNEKEIEIRNILTHKLERGKIYINLSVEFTPAYTMREISIDEASAFLYWNEMQKLAQKLNISLSEQSFIQLLHFNDIWKKNDHVVPDELWQHIVEILHQTIEKVIQFRIQEGENTAKTLRESITKIETLTESITQYESQRIPVMKEKLLQILKEYSTELNEDRLLQELVYYTEKYDISEEKTRLLHHCQYFTENLESNENNGKKLQFIAQEMHREANTLGVKANHVEIQKAIINIKEEIEKIKEQLNNIA